MLNIKQIDNMPTEYKYGIGIGIAAGIIVFLMRRQSAASTPAPATLATPAATSLSAGDVAAGLASSFDGLNQQFTANQAGLKSLSDSVAGNNAGIATGFHDIGAATTAGFSALQTAENAGEKALSDNLSGLISDGFKADASQSAAELAAIGQVQTGISALNGDVEAAQNLYYRMIGMQSAASCVGPNAGGNLHNECTRAKDAIDGIQWNKDDRPSTIIGKLNAKYPQALNPDGSFDLVKVGKLIAGAPLT